MSSDTTDTTPTTPSISNSELLAFIEPDQQRLLDTFFKLVQIDSPSLEEADVAAYLGEVFTDLGLTVLFDSSQEATGSNTGNLLARLPERLFTDTDPDDSGFDATALELMQAFRNLENPTRRLFFSSHMDTVEPGRGISPQIIDGVISSAGPTILGGDDKVGITALIEMLTLLAESKLPHPEIIIMLSVAEELGLKGAKAIDGGFLNFAGEPCLVLDADGAPGNVIIGAPFLAEMTATFHGRAAHAGVSPEAGASAIRAAAKAVAAMPMGRIDEGATANIGTIQGGNANNIVAESCLVTGEARALEQPRLRQIMAEIEACFNNAAEEVGCQVDLQFNEAFAGFRLDKDDDLVKLITDACQTLGLSSRASYTGGASDANIFAGKGLKPVVLGTGMTDVHSKDESLALSDMVNLVRLITLIALSYR